jgi:glycolate oxidase iron-sulfur subunit
MSTSSESTTDPASLADGAPTPQEGPRYSAGDAANGSSAAHPTTAASRTTGAARNPGAEIEYRLFLDCVHCGLCTSACPTYVELGDENDSPRGRIYLMRAVTDGRLQLTEPVRRHLDLCLDCRACESACPSGVQYGRLIEPFRVAMQQIAEDAGEGQAFQPDKTAASGKSRGDWFRRWILLGVFPYPDRMRQLLRPARIAQRLGLIQAAEKIGLLRLLPDRLRRLTAMLPPPRKRSRRLPDFLPAEGKRRARVALFTGCVADAMFRHTHWATARVLQKNGCDVFIPRSQVCCGAIHFHSGESQPARQFADANLAAFDFRELDAVIVNVAGCGAMLKDYGHHWHDDRQADRAEFAHKVQDIHEFLDHLGIVPPAGRIDLVATYHDACHLAHAQKIRQAPRHLLAQIPGLVLKELPESEICCGAAGTYNLTEPEMSDRLSRRKLANILSTGARAVLTANAGCLLQIEREARRQHERLWIAHPIDILDMSYRGIGAPQ